MYHIPVHRDREAGGSERRVKAGGTGGDAEAKVAKKIRGVSFEENENNAMGLSF